MIEKKQKVLLKLVHFFKKTLKFYIGSIIPLFMFSVNLIPHYRSMRHAEYIIHSKSAWDEHMTKKITFWSHMVKSSFLLSFNQTTKLFTLSVFYLLFFIFPYHSYLDFFASSNLSTILSLFHIRSSCLYFFVLLYDHFMWV